MINPQAIKDFIFAVLLIGIVMMGLSVLEGIPSVQDIRITIQRSN